MKGKVIKAIRPKLIYCFEFFRNVSLIKNETSLILIRVQYKDVKHQQFKQKYKSNQGSISNLDKKIEKVKSLFSLPTGLGLRNILNCE